MTELVKHSTERSHDATADAASLLHHYGFDLGGYTIAQLLLAWQEQYPAAWVRLATIEALYQGRYKAISVEQILALWQRRSQPLYHFKHEFEHLVCDNLPETLLPPAHSPQSGSVLQSTAVLDTKLPYHSVALQLPSFEGAVLPADVMLALKTLHSEEIAALTDAQKNAETDRQASLQTHSYKLRSDEQSGSSSAQHSEASAQTTVDPSVLPDAAITLATHEAVQEHIALTANFSEQEQPTETEPITDAAPALALPASEMPAPTAQTGSIARILQQLDDQALNTKAVQPSFRLMAHTLQPKLQLHLTARYQPIWLTETVSKQPIHQFTPEPEPSDFHNKLKAVAQPEEELEEEKLPPET